MSGLLAIIFAITVFFAAVATAMWLVIQKTRDPDNPPSLLGKLGASAILIGAMALAVPILGVIGFAAILICVIVFGALWTPDLGEWIARPITGMFTDAGETTERKPFYSPALARRKQGKYRESIAAIRAQLEQFPGDFEGMMLQAEIEAEELHDLASALVTLELYLAQENNAPEHIAYALNTMADWQLKLALDPEAARAALERIIEKFPDGVLAHKARQRIAHLGSKEMLLHRHDEGRRIALPASPKDIGIHGQIAQPAPPPADPAALAAEYVKQLELHPHDNDAREQLALIYAREFGRLDLARDQLKQLINYTHQNVRDVERWLNLLATLEIELAQDVDEARKALQRIVELFPDTAAAAQANYRMTRLATEVQEKEKSQGLKLGSYERYLGLKKRVT